MPCAYFLNIDDDPIRFPIERNFGGGRGLLEKDIRFVFDTGNETVYKQANRRRWSLPFTLIGPDEYAFFETLHNAVRGRMAPIYFMEDADASPLDVFHVRKEKDFRPVKVEPVRRNNVTLPAWSYTLELTGDLEQVLVGETGVTMLELENIAIDAGALNATMATGPVTPIDDNELLIACMAGREGPYTVDSGLLITDQVAIAGGSHVGGALAYTIQTAAATVNATWTQTGISMAVMLVSFTGPAGVFSPVNHGFGASIDGGYSAITPHIDTRLANFIVVALAERAFGALDPTNTTLLDSEANLWTLGAFVAAGFNERINLYYCVNPRVGKLHRFTAETAIVIESYPALFVGAFRRSL